MKLLLLGGFLGSGKTSILIQLARHIIATEGGGGTTVMIIENEIGEVGVDDKLLKAQGLAVRDLFAGCACCTSGGDLLNDIRQIKDEIDPNWIIIEATGVAYPGDIKESVEAYFHIPVKILSVADAARWKRLWNAMPELIEAQLDCADCILLNKVDLADEAIIAVALETIRGINPAAALYQTTGNLPLDSGIWASIL
jgi:G3E family GTPase